MREVQVDDIVLHLTNNDSISGLSLVAALSDQDFTCPPNTEWGEGSENKPGYLVKLKDFVNLEKDGKAIPRASILNDSNREKLLEILDNKESPVFYNRNLELNQGAYLTKSPYELVRVINKAYKDMNREDLPYLNETLEGNKYWLFIVNPNYLDGRLWKYCKTNSIAAMQYTLERELPGNVTKNRNQIEKIRKDDKVIVYLNNKTVGGIGKVTSPFFEDTSIDNGFDGLFGQRIGLKWITEDFEKSVASIWTQLDIANKILGSQTIHEILESDYEKILNLFISTKERDDHEISLLLKKKQIILYGPPGTGKTFGTKRLAVDIVGDN